MAERKTVKDLNLIDRFLFSEAMDDSRFAEDVLQIILGDQFVLKGIVQTEKEQRNLPLRKLVRLDVWATSDIEEIVDLEAQKENTGNIPKRSRYYQAMIDSNLLESGEVDYNNLNNVYIIVITLFDLFGKGHYRYTFKMGCREHEGLLLNDGATRIFLNTKGKDDENISEELRLLLHYFEDTRDEVLEETESERLQRIRKHVEELRANGDCGIKYLRDEEEKELARRKAIAEGLAEGRSEGRAEGKTESKLEIASKLKQMGFSDEQISEATALTTEQIVNL